MADTDPKKQTWDSYWKSQKPRYKSHETLLNHIFKHIQSTDTVIAEIGAGSGVDALEIARAGYPVVVIDISGESLKLIQSTSKKRGIEIMAVMGDALNLPFKPGSFDFIYHQGLLEHFKDPYSLLSETKTVLKRAGKTLVDVPQTFTVHTLKKKRAMLRGKWFAGWETQYTPNKLRRVLRKAGFKVIDIYGRDYDFLPFVWLRDIKTLGKTRFARPIIPRFISRPVSAVWRFFERSRLSRYLNHSIGAVAVVDENRD